jgi:ribA/ribD-fused uncharacterized protein
MLLENNIIDCAVCFSDAVNKDKFKSLYPLNPRTVKVVSIIRADDERIKDSDFIKSEIKIFSEYPLLAEKYVESKFINAKVIEINGNTEQFIRDKYGDIGIMICDTGKTIIENKLIILDILDTPKLGIFFPEVANLLNEDTIFFYSVDGPYGFMSNLFPCKFIDKEVREWNSSEHYFQAHKFNDPAMFELVRSQTTPKLSYKITYNYQDSFRVDWQEVKDKYMWEALSYKFTQNLILMKNLINTGNKKLVEHAMKDYYYGCGADGSGKNKLGEMLMMIRSQNS